MRTLLLLLLLSVVSGCYGLVVITGDHGTDVIRLSYADSHCLEKAVEWKNNLIEQGYEAKVKVGKRNGKGHAWVEYRKNYKEEWRVLDPADIDIFK